MRDVAKSTSSAAARWVFTVLVLLAGAPSTTAAQADSPFRVHFIDVGQGDATLLEFACGAVLIDTGGESSEDFDSTEMLITYLEEFFIGRPDLNRRLSSLILTHPHLDHTRGVRAVLEHFRPANIVINGQSRGSGIASQRAAHNYALESEQNSSPNDDIGFRAVRVSDIAAGGLTDAVIDPVNCAGADPDIRVLWGQIDTELDISASELANANNNSVVVRAALGGSSVLVGGDLEEDAIPHLLALHRSSAATLDVDIYKVGHHGSANGTTDAYLAAMSPEIAVLSIGSPERETTWSAWGFGHPRQAVITALNRFVSREVDARTVQVATGQHRFRGMSINRAIYATAWDGDVVLEADGAGSFRIAGSSGNAPAAALLDVNTATAAQLEALPGIGRTKAAAIVAYRTAHGGFARLEDLDAVPGIGLATIESIRDFVTLGSTPP